MTVPHEFERGGLRVPTGQQPGTVVNGRPKSIMPTGGEKLLVPWMSTAMFALVGHERSAAFPEPVGTPKKQCCKRSKLLPLASVSKQLPRLALEHRRSVEAEFCVGDDPVAVNPQYGRCSGHTAQAMDLGPIQ